LAGSVKFAATATFVSAARAAPDAAIAIAATRAAAALRRMLAHKRSTIRIDNTATSCRYV
jgi:hypothetical protein